MTATTERPPLVKIRGLFYPTDRTPEEVFQAIGQLRKEAQQEIDRLLAFLDETDGDADLEPAEADEDDGVTEPSLGWTLTTDQASRQFHGPLTDQWSVDVEDEHDGREPDDSGIGDLEGLLEQVPEWAHGYA